MCMYFAVLSWVSARDWISLCRSDTLSCLFEIDLGLDLTFHIKILDSCHVSTLLNVLPVILTLGRTLHLTILSNSLMLDKSLTLIIFADLLPIICISPSNRDRDGDAGF